MEIWTESEVHAIIIPACFEDTDLTWGCKLPWADAKRVCTVERCIRLNPRRSSGVLTKRRKESDWMVSTVIRRNRLQSQAGESVPVAPSLTYKGYLSLCPMHKFLILGRRTSWYMASRFKSSNWIVFVVCLVRAMKILSICQCHCRHWEKRFSYVQPTLTQSSVNLR